MDVVIFETHTLSFTLKKHTNNHISYFSKFIEPYDP